MILEVGSLCRFKDTEFLIQSGYHSILNYAGSTWRITARRESWYLQDHHFYFDLTNGNGLNISDIPEEILEAVGVFDEVIIN